jgi:hypothetical protein
MIIGVFKPHDAIFGAQNVKALYAKPLYNLTPYRSVIINDENFGHSVFPLRKVPAFLTRLLLIVL